MASELIYTDGACSKNGTANASGGFGIYICKTEVFENPTKINYKGEEMRLDFQDTHETFYVTNIRMEGLAIVSTLALYANVLIDNIPIGKATPIERLRACNPFDVTEMKVGYEFSELRSFNQIDPSAIEIVTDSLFWINVIQSWMPGWLRKGIMMQKKNQDILLMIHHYMEKFRQNNITVVLTHVRSHQKGARTVHADGNDVADELATSATQNLSPGFHKQ
jgi:ribonuclease HI